MLLLGGMAHVSDVCRPAHQVYRTLYACTGEEDAGQEHRVFPESSNAAEKSKELLPGQRIL
jgi:hypothetical protein